MSSAVWSGPSGSSNQPHQLLPPSAKLLIGAANRASTAWLSTSMPATLLRSSSSRRVSPQTAWASRKIARFISDAGVGITSHSRTCRAKALAGWHHCGLLSMMCPGHGG